MISLVDKRLRVDLSNTNNDLNSLHFALEEEEQGQEGVGEGQEQEEVEEEEEDEDTISDLSFDEENYYNKEEIIMANRSSSFKIPTSTIFINKSNQNNNQSTTLTAGGGGEGAHTSTPSTQVAASITTSNIMKLDTIRGVLLPCLQTNMFGALLFVKLPFLLSKLGILISLFVLILSIGSTLFTLLSHVALATNGKFKKSAGLYALIKKHLGLEIGACIGLLHLVQKVGVTSMYCLAAAETALSAVGFSNVFPNKTTIFGIILCFILSIVCLFPKIHKSLEDIAVGLALLSVISFIVGTISFAADAWDGGLGSEEREFAGCFLPRSNTFHDPRDGSEALIATPFVHLLSIFYASFSGFVGASTRSGNIHTMIVLKQIFYFFTLNYIIFLIIYFLPGYLLTNPGLSIPFGTFSSAFIVIVLVIYIIIILGLNVSSHGLSAHRVALAELSWPLPLIGFIGITICNVSAAFVNLKGIPRLISLIDDDGAVPFFRFLASQNHHHLNTQLPVHASTTSSPRFFTSLTFHTHQLRYLHPRKLLFTFFVTAIPCVAGDFVFISQFVAIPTLLVYVALNLSCFILAFIKAPGFRPNWKYFR